MSKFYDDVSVTETLFTWVTQAREASGGDEAEILDGKLTLPSPIENDIALGNILGSGGMGIVYEGYQTLPERNVAVKKAKDNDLVLEKLLLHEAKISGMLEHPNIVPIHEIRRSQDDQYEIVMKRIQGTSLKSYMGEHRHTMHGFDRCLEALAHTCNALAYAHDRGIIHRDVKTQNIMLGQFGETYLLDWGIAIQMDKPDDFPVALVGTPSGMPPEMLHGDPARVSPVTDIYLMGSTLHELLMGHPRHSAKASASFQELKESINSESLFSYPDSVPEVLADLANDCCRHNPTDRIQSILTVRDRIKEFLKKRNALELLASGKHEMSIVRKLLHEEQLSQLNRVKLYHHIHRARFAFERALVVDPSLEESRQELQHLVDQLTLMLLHQGNLKAASWFVESTGFVSESIQSQLAAADSLARGEEAEAKRLQELGKSNDPSGSLFSRLMLVGAVIVCSAMVFYFDLSAALLGGGTMRADLLVQSIVLLLSLSVIVYGARNRL